MNPGSGGAVPNLTVKLFHQIRSNYYTPEVPYFLFMVALGGGRGCGADVGYCIFLVIGYRLLLACLYQDLLSRFFTFCGFSFARTPALPLSGIGMGLASTPLMGSVMVFAMANENSLHVILFN